MHCRSPKRGPVPSTCCSTSLWWGHSPVRPLQPSCPSLPAPGMPFRPWLLPQKPLWPPPPPGQPPTPTHCPLSDVNNHFMSCLFVLRYVALWYNVMAAALDLGSFGFSMPPVFRSTFAATPMMWGYCIACTGRWLAHHCLPHLLAADQGCPLRLTAQLLCTVPAKVLILTTVSPIVYRHSTTCGGICFIKPSAICCLGIPALYIVSRPSSYVIKHMAPTWI